MLIVDSQVHIWGADTPERPWPISGPRDKTGAHADRPFMLPDLLAHMRDAGVDRVVIVPPQWEGFRNDLGLEAAGGRDALAGRGGASDRSVRCCDHTPNRRVVAGRLG